MLVGEGLLVMLVGEEHSLFWKAWVFGRCHVYWSCECDLLRAPASSPAVVLDSAVSAFCSGIDAFFFCSLPSVSVGFHLSNGWGARVFPPCPSFVGEKERRIWVGFLALQLWLLFLPKVCTRRDVLSGASPVFWQVPTEGCGCNYHCITETPSVFAAPRDSPHSHQPIPGLYEFMNNSSWPLLTSVWLCLFQVSKHSLPTFSCKHLSLLSFRLGVALRLWLYDSLKKSHDLEVFLAFVLLF